MSDPCRGRIITDMRVDVRDHIGQQPGHQPDRPSGPGSGRQLGDHWCRRLGRVEVDLEQRPDLVRLPGEELGAPGTERFLNWDGAVDDSKRLRKCVVCGGGSLYRNKVLPQVTPFVVLLAFAGAIIGLLGYATNPLVLPALVGLLIVDVATLALARERLICYRCGSVYSGLRVARYHRRWSRLEAERVRALETEIVASSSS